MYIKTGKNIKKIVIIISSAWILVGSLFGMFSGNALEVQAVGNQLPDGNGEGTVDQERLLVIRSESDLWSWMNYKDSGAQNVVQSITHIKISGVTSIPNHAFADLANLNTVTFDMAEPPILGTEVFRGRDTQRVDFYVPYNNEVIAAYQNVLDNQLGHSNFRVDGIPHDLTIEGMEIVLPENDISQPGESISQRMTKHKHTHTWFLKEYVAATATEDAMVVPICESCGIVGRYTKRPGSAHLRFLLDTAEKITDATPNSEVIVSTELWVSINHCVTDALTERVDVSLTINYKYKGKYYTLTIPAGCDVKALSDENGWVGFRYIDSVLPGKELTKEEFETVKNLK